MARSVAFASFRPTNTVGDVALAWRNFECVIDHGFWAERLVEGGSTKEDVFLVHWRMAFGCELVVDEILAGRTLGDQEFHAYLVDALHRDVRNYQRLVRDGMVGEDVESGRPCPPVSELDPLMAAVIHLCRSWCGSDDLVESFAVLEAWAGAATRDDVENIIECLPHPELPPQVVLQRLLAGEHPPIKVVRDGGQAPAGQDPVPVSQVLAHLLPTLQRV